MRYRLILILVFAMGLLSAVTSVPDYRQTLGELSKLEEKGISNPDLYYNIGVCHARLGNESKAVLYFLRALNLNSAHRDARHNLDYIISLSPDRELYPRRQFVGNILLSFYHWFNLNRLALALLIMLLITALSTHWLLHYPGDRERGLPVLLTISAAILLTCVLIAMVGKIYRLQYNRKAVVQSPSAQLYASPDSERNSIRVLHQSLIVEISQSKGDWFMVNLPGGINGWVKRQDVLRVTP